jgi:hypothetical protein
MHQHNTEKYPFTDGQVYAILPDGQGGFFIGGYFQKIGRYTHSNIGHIFSDGTVDPFFNVNVDGGVICLASDGTNLYFGGYFYHVNNIARNYVASVNKSTGALTSFNPNANNTVNTLAYSNGTVYLGGDFTTLNGNQTRNYAGAVTTSNVLTSWDPNLNNSVSKIVVNANGARIFLAGNFTTVKGLSYPSIAKVNNTTGQPLSWKPNPDNSVSEMLLNGGYLYIGGYFTSLNGVNRLHVASIDTTAGVATGLKADVSSRIEDLFISAGKLYVAGNFDHIQNLPRLNIAQIDLTTGLVTKWNSNQANSPNTDVISVAVNGHNVMMGGWFEYIGYTPGNFITKIDISNSIYKVIDWHPVLQGYDIKSVNDILHYGHDVFACGNFYYHYDGVVPPMFNLIALSDSSAAISHQFTEYPDAPLTLLGVFDKKLMVAGSFKIFIRCRMLLSPEFAKTSQATT